jgi:hypothetical protein
VDSDRVWDRRDAFFNVLPNDVCVAVLGGQMKRREPLEREHFDAAPQSAESVDHVQKPQSASYMYGIVAVLQNPTLKLYPRPRGDSPNP